MHFQAQPTVVIDISLALAGLAVLQDEYIKDGFISSQKIYASVYEGFGISVRACSNSVIEQSFFDALGRTFGQFIEVAGQGCYLIPPTTQMIRKREDFGSIASMS